MLDVAEVTGWLDKWYPPSTAEDWDRVGLIVGSRAAPVRKIMLAVDPVEETASQAIDWGADLLITHHPLYLRGTSFVSEDDYKGRIVAALIRSNVALYNAHTNADMARDGVAQALADLLGVKNAKPMVPTAAAVSANPDAAHMGLGRIGRLETPLPLTEFAQQVAQRLPKGPTGILVGGEPQRIVSKVAVSGGSGDSFLATAAELGADAYVTADLRHHPSSEHLEAGGPALICGSHWATEWPWLPVLARRLTEQSIAVGQAVDVMVSRVVTEPWFEHLPTEGRTS